MAWTGLAPLPKRIVPNPDWMSLGVTNEVGVTKIPES